jgi:hypothetical protein
VRAVACLLAASALLTSGCGGGGDAAPLPEGRFIAASHTISPRVQLFAEPVVARIDVIVDRSRFDPDLVRVAASFAPYERQGEVLRGRNDVGRFTHLRFSYTLRCLTYDCLPLVGGGPPQSQPGGIPSPPGSQGGGFGERKTVELERARVVYDDPAGRARILQNVTWPPIQSVSRLNFGDTSVTGVGFPFEASVTPLPKLSYRVAPVLLGASLIVAALALLVLPAALVVRALRHEPVVEDRTPELSPLEKALHLVEWARDRTDAARREALEALAVELEAVGSYELMETTRRLAWSPTAPSPEAVDAVARSVRESSEPAV